MKTAVIVQARIGSKRLPGKVLLPLNGHTVVEEVLLRCKRIGADLVVCAIPDTPENLMLGRIVKQHAILVYGDESDVLDRYYLAAQIVNAGIIVRVTADCPLIDPALCAEVMAAVVKGPCDYACNNMPRTFPHGLDCEAFTMRTLRKAAKRAKKPYEREHVTTWMREAPSVLKVNITNGTVVDNRVTLDTEEDYHKILGIFNQRVPIRGGAGASIQAAV